MLDPLRSEHTASVLWFFDGEQRLTQVDLDRGSIHRFPIEPDVLIGMGRSVAVFRGDAGTDVIAHDGTVPLRGVSGGFEPLADPSTDALWALGEPDNSPPYLRPWLRYQPPIAVPTAAAKPLRGGWPIAASGTRLLLRTSLPNGGSVDWVDSISGSTQHVADGCALAANRYAVVTNQPCGTGGQVSVHDLTRETAPVALPVAPPVIAVTLSPNGQFVAVLTRVGDGARTDIFDARSGALLQTTSRFAARSAWTLDSRYLVIVDAPDLIAWRVEDGAILELPYKPTALFGIAITAR